MYSSVGTVKHTISKRSAIIYLKRPHTMRLDTKHQEEKSRLRIAKMIRIKIKSNKLKRKKREEMLRVVTNIN